MNPNDQSTTAKFEYGTTTSYGSEISAAQSPVSGSSPVDVSAQITGLSPNTGYHYRVVATNSSGTTQGSDLTFTTELPAYPSSFSVNSTMSFPDRDKASDYKTNEFRIVGLPGASNRPITDFLSGSHNKDWQLYWHNGTGVEEYDGSSVFNFSVGRAFWVIKKGSLNIDTDVPSAPLNTSNEVEIPLHAGWNLITNPFTSSLSWSEIQSVNNISEPVWSYLGSFNQSSTFQPYVGYFLFNAASLSSLKIPYSLIFSSSLAVGESDSGIWRINIKLSAGEVTDQSAWFGVSRMASSGLDPYDLRKPETLAFTPTVYFHRPLWDKYFSSFATDIRPEFEESQTWVFAVQTIPGVQAQLVLSDIESVPSQFEVYLINEEKANYFNLREDSLYSFTPAAEISKFSIIVGKEDAVNERLKSVIPKEFALGNNYPNPFNPKTNIPLTIPFTSEVELIVYNILGEKIKIVYTGELGAGQHLFSWDGRDDAGNQLASGVYIYYLKTQAKKSFAGKMILMK
ncbi:T9SS type A sorting domain-containing protein [candidate division KSB1 bacterium]|nr:T9SS type A sorting domain-containing protein [candidate division KSB1 bacterium]